MYRFSLTMRLDGEWVAGLECSGAAFKSTDMCPLVALRRLWSCLSKEHKDALARIMEKAKPFFVEFDMSENT